MSRALDWALGAILALGCVAWALLLVIAGVHRRHNPPPDQGRREGEDPPRPRP